MSQLEREEEQLEQAYERGEISLAELNEELRIVQREYCESAKDAAQDAYDREMERW